MRAMILGLPALTIAAFALVPLGCGGDAKLTALPPPEVSVSQPLEEPVQETLEFTGRTSAVESVEVRARVTGYITKVAFTAGALVKAGDLLFEIDAREYQAAVLRAEGQVARLQAVLARAESEVGRTTTLRPSGAASAREVERARLEVGARADVDQQRIPLFRPGPGTEGRISEVFMPHESLPTGSGESRRLSLALVLLHGSQPLFNAERGFSCYSGRPMQCNWI